MCCRGVRMVLGGESQQQQHPSRSRSIRVAAATAAFVPPSLRLLRLRLLPPLSPPLTAMLQGVHMMFDGEFSEAWGDGEERESRFCFIGKNLDKDKVPAPF